MSALQHLPVIKALTPFLWNIGRPAMSIEMPFADISGIITGFFIHFCNRDRLAVEAEIIQEKPVGQRILPGHQRSAIWRTDRAGRDSIAYIYTLPGHLIQIGGHSFKIGIAGIVCGLRPPLIGQHINNIRFFSHNSTQSSAATSCKKTSRSQTRPPHETTTTEIICFSLHAFSLLT